MLTQEIVNSLLQEDENLWLEFKSYWYWIDREKELGKSWGELLKDFAAIFNTYDGSNSIKYIVFGYDEKTSEMRNFYIDKEGKSIKIFNDLVTFKKDFIKKLKKHFFSIPEYKKTKRLADIEKMFDIDTITMNGCRLMVFTIYPSPYILELKTILQGNESFREGSILVRKIKADGSPENKNASSDEVERLKNFIQERRQSEYPQRDINIQKVVEVFKDKHLPSAKTESINKRQYSTGIHFHVTQFHSKYLDICFIYFSKYTSQNKTVDFIKNENLINSACKRIIILVDEFNREGGKIDKERVNALFAERYPGLENIEIHYLESFALENLYSREEFSAPIFLKDKSFYINDFVKPYTTSSDQKTVGVLLNEWYNDSAHPLLVLKGIGGIGKTTVTKFFLDTLLQSEIQDNYVLFISSHDIIDEIRKSSMIEDLFDFYRLVARKNGISYEIDRRLFELSIDSGNLIVALDGLDEVIQKAGKQFNINSFINSIFNVYSESFEKAKVIITCRDYFWDRESIAHPIREISLKPFNEAMAKKYFELSLEKERKVKRAMELANEFALKEDNKTYIPYILDMIKDDLLASSESREIESETLNVNHGTNDYLVGKVCEREIEKLGNIDIDRQVDFFVRMAVNYDGVISKEHLFRIKDDLEIPDAKLDAFKDHPLLYLNVDAANKEAEKLSFRYDFFREYFQGIALANLLRQNSLELITTELINVIIQSVGYDNSFTKDLKKRLFEDSISVDDLKFFIWEIIQSLDTLSSRIQGLNKNKAGKLNSSLFVLLMVLLEVESTDDRTELVKEIYGLDDVNVINNLCLINLYSSRGKILFDFRGLELRNCRFENYDCFASCLYDGEVIFYDTDFFKPLHRKGLPINITRTNIDIDSCPHSTDIFDIIEEAENQYSAEISRLKKDLKKIIRFFWVGGSFQQKLASEVNSKYQSLSKVIGIMIDKKVITKVDVTTKQKRVDTAYMISEDFMDLRKIMEENKTCTKFDEILNMFKE
jgi:hypothetical protein